MTKKHKVSQSKEEKKALEVICPRCGAFPQKSCKHTSGSKKGTKCKPHGARIEMSKKKLSDTAKRKIEALNREEVFQVKPVKKSKSAQAKDKAKTAKEKLTPEQQEIVETLTEKIEALGRHADFVGPVSVGPIISTYRFFPYHKTKVAHLETMAKDFAVSLGAEAIVVKRMPGESAVGVFVPNKVRKMVMFRDTLTSVIEFQDEVPSDKHLKIPINFGINSDGEPFVDDLTAQPHLLIAGTTGSGKSTVEHAILLSMAFTMKPTEHPLFLHYVHSPLVYPVFLSVWITSSTTFPATVAIVEHTIHLRHEDKFYPLSKPEWLCLRLDALFYMTASY